MARPWSIANAVYSAIVLRRSQQYYQYYFQWIDREYADTTTFSWSCFSVKVKKKPSTSNSTDLIIYSHLEFWNDNEKWYSIKRNDTSLRFYRANGFCWDWDQPASDMRCSNSERCKVVVEHHDVKWKKQDEKERKTFCHRASNCS